MKLKISTLITIILLFIFIFYKLTNTPEKQIKKTILKIQKELSQAISENIILKSKSIIRITNYFSKDFTGIIESQNINTSQELKETVSWVIMTIVPIQSKIEFKSIEINNKNAKIIVNVLINTCKNALFNNKNYVFNISFIKINKTWKISSIFQEKLSK